MKTSAFSMFIVVGFGFGQVSEDSIGFVSSIPNYKTLTMTFYTILIRNRNLLEQNRQMHCYLIDKALRGYL
jgi:hypothetical protein